MWQVRVDYIKEWLDSLDGDTLAQVVAALELLSEIGSVLGRPLVDTVKASRHANMKELRPGSAGRSEIRILFAFDPVRRAVMLYGGDKSGNWKGWYKEAIPLADRLFDDYLAGLDREGDW